MLKIIKRSISRWLKEEDDSLLSLVNEYGPCWSLISTRTLGRTAVECRRRHRKLTLPDSPPTDLSDDGWEQASNGDWVRVPMEEIGRSPFARLASQLPTFKHSWERKGWSEEERLAVIEGFFEHGPQWDKIAGLLHRRTGDQCRRLFERTFVLFADSGVPEIEQLKKDLFTPDCDEMTIAVSD